MNVIIIGSLAVVGLFLVATGILIYRVVSAIIKAYDSSESHS